MAPIALLAHRVWVDGGLRLQDAADRLATLGAGLLAVAVVAAAAASPFRALSLPHVWPTLGGVALLLWLRQAGLTYRGLQPLLATALALAGFGLTATSLFQWSSESGFNWAHRNAFPFGHSITTAGAMVLLLPWMALAAWRSCGLGRAGAALGVVAALIVLGSTGSRGGILALLVAAGVATLVILYRASWSPRRKAFVLLGVAAIGIVGIASNERLRDLALGGGWSEIARESNDQRTAMLAAGRLLGQQRPLLGWGPGTVPLTYPLVRAQLPGGVDNVLQLHSSPLQVWATLGLAGVAALLILGSGALAAVRRALGSPVRATAAFSLGAYLLFTLTDHQLDVPLMNATVAANLALLTAQVGWRRPNEEAGPEPHPHPTLARPRHPSRWLVAAALLLLAAAATPATVRDALGRRAYLVDDFDRAIAWMPADAYYYHQRANRDLLARSRATRPAEHAALTAAATETLRHSLTTSAHLEYAHFNLGWLALERDDAAAAVHHFRAAAALAPTRGSVYFGLGLAYRSLEREQAAIRAFAIEAVNDPAFLAMPPWEWPELAPTRAAIQRELEQIRAALLASGDAAASELVARLDWARWWSGETVPLQGFSAASRAFVAALADISARRPLPPAAAGAAWARLYATWRADDWATVTSDATFNASLQRGAQLHATDFLAFLRAGTGGDAVLVRQLRRIRPGYGVVAFHPDGAPPSDIPPIVDNRMLATFAHELMPPKGARPARVLLEWLPPAELATAERIKTADR